VLVVEDNRVNQTLAKRLLVQRGHRVTLAENGRKALDLVAKRAFDLVLMDVQMPVMNGLEAAAAIRERERGTGRHVPIVALTAHAMRGDRERALAAGMDTYLVKPVQREMLFATVESLAAPPEPAAVTPLSSGAIGAGAAAIVERLGDAALARELADVFLNDRPAMVRRIEHALAAGDGRELRMAAHALKGAVANFGFPDATGAAQRLERAAESAPPDAWEQAWAELKRDLNRAVATLRALAEPSVRGEKAPRGERAPRRRVAKLAARPTASSTARPAAKPAAKPTARKRPKRRGGGGR
jgi:CheY-like chemotaxis protein/HPt (histidine-containing phosphotransfer) domain-containing protein